MQAMQKYNLRAFRAGPSPKLVARAPTMTRVAKVEADIMADGDSSSANMMSFEELTKIIKMVQDTDIVDIELKGKRFSLAIKKQEALKAAEPIIIHQAMPTPMQQYAPAPMAPAPAAAAPAPAAAAPAAAPAAPRPAAPAGKADGAVEIVSPMSGTMYRSPAPGEPAFVKEGDVVKKGQTVCIIEAMKLMNEIEADVSGTVLKVLVDNGGLVAPGTPLLLIKP